MTNESDELLTERMNTLHTEGRVCLLAGVVRLAYGVIAYCLGCAFKPYDTSSYLLGRADSKPQESHVGPGR